MDVQRLLEIMARLRDPERGCPWDLEQGFATIAPCTIEEAYEVDDAIRREDWDALCEELGDLLLQVVFHARMAQEAGHFAFGDVVASICDKLVRRHPHVFGDARIETARAQTEAWEQHKREERAARGETGAMDGVALALPALLRARKLVSRAVRAGLPQPDPDRAAAQVAERLAALCTRSDADPPRREALLGDLLLAVVVLARGLGVEPEDALREAAARFEQGARRRDAMPRP